MNISYRLLACCYAFLLFGQEAMAQSIFDREKVSVIQERIFDRKHEINLGSGYIPDDDYYDSYSAAVSYSYHFSKFFSWEVIKGQYFYNEEKEIKNQLEDEFQVTPETFDHLAYMVHSSLVLKPTYGKDALFDSVIINHESYYLLGVGLAKYQRDYSFDESSEETALSVTVGAGRRFFLSQNIAITFDLKSYTNFKEQDTETNIYMGMGISFRFNISDHDSQVREKTESVYGYLNHDKD